MKLVIALLLATLACVLASPTLKLDAQFAKYVLAFGKEYTAEEVPHRLFAFQASLNRIEKLNAEARSKGKSTKFALNKFSDLTPEEFSKQYFGYKPRPKPAVAPKLFKDTGVTIPDSFDWRSKGAVTPVKDQGQCGSCWAFSATEGIESAWFLSKKKLVVLSPQEIVSCDTTDLGCNGGDLPTAYQYVEGAGMETESSYPYTSGSDGDSGTCEFDASKVVVQITGFEYATQSGNETAMQAASVTNGPLSICVDAETWQDYTGGVIESDCGNSLDHCVQIVGWDTQASDSAPYWIIRNSWGTDWGLSGYILVERNQDLCGVADEATYVTV